MVQHADIDHTGLTGVGGALTVENEGTPLATAATTLDFVGAGVTASGAGAEKTITIAGGGVADQGAFTYFDATEAAAPSTPASGFVRIYAKADGRIYSKDDAGTEFGPFDAAGVGGGSSSYAAAILGHADILRFWGLDEPSGTSTHDDEVGSDDLADFGAPLGRSATLNRDTDTGRDLSLFKNGAGMGVWRAAGGYTWPAAWTIEFVVAFLQQNGDAGIVGQWNGSGSMLHSNGSVLTAYFGGSTAVQWDASTAWYGVHHIAFGHDGTDGHLWVDGVQRDTATVTGPTTTAGGNFMVGGYSGSGTGGMFLIQALAYYDAWIGGTDIAAHSDLVFGT